MKKKDPEEKLSDLFHGDLSPEEAEKINSELKETGGGEDEVESMHRISHLLDKIPVEDPSSSMDRRFYSMLHDEQQGSPAIGRNSATDKWFPKSSLRAGLRIAAGIALFLLGWFSSSWLAQRSYSANEVSELTGEMKELRETLVLTMLNQPSTLERIKAVNMVSRFETADDRIIESLLVALNSDKNDNVRLLSLEALLKYSDNPAVREGLIASIKNQTSPVIQLRLAEVMIALDEKKAVPEFKELLSDPGMNYMVRNKIDEAVTFLL